MSTHPPTSMADMTDTILEIPFRQGRFEARPNAAMAVAHEEEARRLYEEVKRALPNDQVALVYWERTYREGA